MLKRRADKKPSTLNDGTNQLQSKIITVFTTKMKSPNDNTVNGNDRNKIIGRTKLFNRLRTIATIIAVQKLFISTPGRIFAVKYAPNEVRINFTIVPIIKLIP